MGSERGSESIGVSEEGSPPRSRASARLRSSPLLKAAPLSCAVGSSRRERLFIFFFPGWRAPVLIALLIFLPLAAMPCSEDAAVGSVSKRARAEDGSSLRFVRLSEHATAPTRGSARAAGYDLYR